MMAFRAAAIVVLMPAGSSAYAPNRIGGHFGIALPLIAHAQGETATISDDFVIAFRPGSPFASRTSLPLISSSLRWCRTIRVTSI